MIGLLGWDEMCVRFISPFGFLSEQRCWDFGINRGLPEDVVLLNCNRNLGRKNKWAVCKTDPESEVL